MGDRANIYIVDRRKVADDDYETQGIYLYTHWNGYDWPEMLRQALATEHATRRRTDEPYLVRILVDQLFRSIRDEETGGGISTYLTDNSYPVTVLDVATGEVGFAAAGTETDRTNWRDMQGIANYVQRERVDYPADML